MSTTIRPTDDPLDRLARQQRQLTSERRHRHFMRVVFPLILLLLVAAGYLAGTYVA